MIHHLFGAIDGCMLADRRRLHGTLRNIKIADRAGKNVEHDLVRLQRQIEQSAARLDRRKELLPAVKFEGGLPIDEKREEIKKAIAQHPVVIVCGDTGSGKSTQLPKICLDMGRGVSGYIGHTQPRRLAARSIAARVAEELESPLGEVVGFKVRFAEHFKPTGYVKVMTDGMLLAETTGDRNLMQYDTLIIDEAHERSLNIDFLMGYLHQLLPRRADLKVIITSATIDPQRFSRFFNDAPVVEVSGRMYPVQVVYRPLPVESADEQEVDTVGRIVQTVGEIARGELKYEEEPRGEELQIADCRLQIAEGGNPGAGIQNSESRIQKAEGEAGGEGLKFERGKKDGPSPQPSPTPGLGRGSLAEDILVFLPGEREIRETAEAIAGSLGQRVEVLPLYARLAFEQQQRIFSKHGKRRVILSTNVAETSLTVPGVGFVIDTGLARMSRYNPRSKVQRLPVEAIAQASAEQRKGRCGRVAPGVCVRLYDEQDFVSRPRFTPPEILRTNLASVILQMKHLGLGDPDEFPFVEAPSFRMIQDGYQTLVELGAIDSKNDLTPIGQKLARLPVDPRIGRMILAGEAEGCLREVLIIASALAVQDPRDRPMEKQEAADRAHGQFKHPTSDFLSWVNLWEAYHHRASHLSRAKTREWCHTHFLSFVRMREWHDVHKELVEILPAVELKPPREGARPAHHDAVHRALLTGLLSNVGMKTEEGDYVGPRGTKFRIHPGSTLYSQKQPQWIMAAEIVETTRFYARTVAAVRTPWIETLARHLVGRDYFKPFWDDRKAKVIGYEKVMLHGLVVQPGRQVPYGHVDPQAARDVFIQQGLVEGKYQTDAAFAQNNRRLEREVRLWERKLRKPLLVGESKRYEFYDVRIPKHIFSGIAFETWRRKVEHDKPGLLLMKREDLLLDPGVELDPEQFPDELEVNGLKLAVEYLHDAGNAKDGLTLVAPLAALGQITQEACDYLTPGMLREKVEAMLRALPKQWRTAFVPVPEFAKRAHEMMAERGNHGGKESGLSGRTPQVRLAAALSEVLGEITGVRVPLEAWKDAELPEHLRMHYRVIDEAGQTLEEARNLADLQKKFADQAAQSLIRLAGEKFKQDGIKGWTFGDLPMKVDVPCGPSVFDAYPGVVDAGASVSLRLFPTQAEAEKHLRIGVRRLFMLEMATDIERFLRGNATWKRLAVLYATHGPAEELRDDVVATVVDRVFMERQPGGGIVRTHEEFEVRLRSGWPVVVAGIDDMLGIATGVLEAEHELRKLLDKGTPQAWGPAVFDVQDQMKKLLPKGFLLATPDAWRGHLPRYVKGAAVRLRKIAGGGLVRDRQWMDQIRPWVERYEAKMRDLQAEGKEDPRFPRIPQLEEFRWLLEECRVALFAQELKTSVPMSVARLEKKWLELGQ